MLAAGHDKIKHAACFLASARVCYHELRWGHLSPGNILRMNVLLISTYELGRQPFGLAEPAAWLERAGAEVACLDLSRDELGEGAVRRADLVAFYIPMHTATRLAVAALPMIRRLNPRAKLAFYGLYAPVNESYLRSLGAEIIVGGEFEEGLVEALRRLIAPSESAPDIPVVSLARQRFLVPKRSGLPSPARYAKLRLPNGEKKIVGSTEASRGCKHFCRHCPIVPVYNGIFRIIPRDVVLEDIRQQVEAGVEHITFGDPDFLNGPRHALDIVKALHQEFPWLTYDATIKIEHLLKHSNCLATLRDTGCLFVTSAVESVDDRVLVRLNKGHTVADFVAVVELFREAGLCLSPTFVPFTPWTTLEDYLRLLERISELGLVDHVAPVQLGIRLLIPAGSRLLELREVRDMTGPFDEPALVYPWASPDPEVDELCRVLQGAIHGAEKAGGTRREIFTRVWELAHRAAGQPAPQLPKLRARATIPYLTEPWYC
jgi:radical SAM superfamily enzyme YgiQ (UPF0313 family)